jgi:heptosyltransferase III
MLTVNRAIDFAVGVPLCALAGALMGRETPTSSPRRLLIIKLAAAGDTVLLTSVIRSLRQAYPTAELHWLISSINRGLAETVPGIDRLILWSGKSPLALLRLAHSLRNAHYDAVIDFEQWARGTALLTAATGAPIRIGFDTPGQFRTKPYTLTYKKEFKEHESRDFAALAARLGPLPNDYAPFLLETEAGKREAALVLPPVRVQGRRRVLLHPGCGSDGRPREWPLTNYAVLGHWLLKLPGGVELYLSGGPEETDKTRRLRKLLNGEAVNLGGRVSWQGLVSVVAAMDLVVSGNTGVMHVAAALGKDQVAFHGPTNPALWGPLNPRARVLSSSCPQCPCLRLGYEYHTRDGSCMARIDVEDAKAAVTALFDKPGEI